MPNRPAAALVLRPGDREQLVSWTRSSSVRAGLAQRARIVLLAAEGLPNTAIAEKVGVNRQTVIGWRGRYRDRGLAGLADRPRSGRPRHIDHRAGGGGARGAPPPPPRRRMVLPVSWPALAAVAIAIQWIAFVPAWFGRTERFYDLVGSGTFIAVTLLALTARVPGDTRAIVLAAMVIVWAVRLGSFLVARIHRKGRDDRFDAIKQSFPRFLLAWTMQGVWVAVTAAPALLAIAGSRGGAGDVLSGVARRIDARLAKDSGLDAFLLLGTVVWFTGFAIEVVADAQKSRFAADPANRGRFITTGLWARSRHPNYFGEILLWCGVSLAAFPALEGWERLALLSPLFVAWLLTRVSGIPLLERKAEAKWGGQPEYEAYRERTPVLVPRIRSAATRHALA
jgi:steroid 5-alpha reductase family enzyme